MLKKVSICLLILLIPLMIYSQDRSFDKIKLFLNTGKLLYDEHDNVYGFTFDWEFGFEDKETGGLEIGINKETLKEIDLSVLEKIKSDSCIVFKVILEVGDTVKDGQLINKVNQYEKKIFGTRKVTVPDDFPDIKSIEGFRAYKLSVFCENVDCFYLPVQVNRKEKVIKVIPEHELIGSEPPGELWYTLSYTVNEGDSTNLGYVFSETIVKPGAFKLFVDENILPVFVRGGTISIVLTIFGLIGIILFFVYLSYFSSKNFLSVQFDNRVMENWKKFFQDPTLKNYYDVIRREKGVVYENNVLEKIFYNALMKHLKYKNHWSRYVQVHQSLDDNLLLEAEAKKTIPVKKKFLKWIENFFNIEYFWNMGSLAPMLGLLGTVIGIADAFSQVALNPDVPKEELIRNLSGGINTALYTTIFGLAVGIPMMIFYYYLKFKLDSQIFTISEKFNKFFFLKEL